jgi:hypothetical protein
MLPLAQLRLIAAARLADAQALSKARRYDGAAYLCGYVVELRLKARICRTLNWPSFPETNNEFKPFQSFKTHDLDVLLRLCGREAYIKKHHLADWSAVSRWNPEARYQPVGTMSKQEAEQMIAAAIVLSKKL